MEKYVLDHNHPMNIVKYLKAMESSEFTLQQLKQILELWEEFLSQEEMVRLINNLPKSDSLLLQDNSFKRLDLLKQELLSSDIELFWINDELTFNQRKLLKGYVQKLNIEVIPKLKDSLKRVVEDFPIENGFPSISFRAKNADGILDKISRMKKWNAWKAPRDDYTLSDMPDAVWWRITVKDVTQLENVMLNMEKVFWKENIYEIDNFYSSSKKTNPYRIVSYAVLVEWTPCEVQLTTLRSSLVADLWHNTWYKQIHNLPKETVEKISNLQRQVTLEEHKILSKKNR